MPRFTRRRSIAAATAIGAVALFTGSAQAAMVDHDTPDTLGNSSFEFRSGDLYWHFTNGAYSAHLTGTLRLDDANGSCARMRLEYFNNGDSIATKYGGPVCAPDGRSHDYDVDLNPYASANTDLVKVSVQTKTASHDWSILESSYFKPDLHVDNVRMGSDGVDFGDWRWLLGTTEGAGTMSWDRGDGAKITPHLRGDLWLNNVAGVCARVRMRYYSTSGSLLADEHGGPACASDNSLQGWNVDLATYTGTSIGKVVVTMQTQAANGSWNTVPNASDTAYVDEDK
ncbi:MAG: hypothetical protein U0Y82_11630 [Thermoleophilia bacterium]